MSKWVSDFVAKWHQTLKSDAQASHLLFLQLNNTRKHINVRMLGGSRPSFVNFWISCATHAERYVFLYVFKLQKRANAMPVHKMSVISFLLRESAVPF